jgi:hypothetical protein
MRTPSCSLTVWKKLYRAAAAFKEIACWDWMTDTDVFGVQNPETREIGLRQVVTSTDYFRPYSPNPAELMRMFLDMLHEGGLSKDEIRTGGCINSARLMGLKIIDR